MKDWMKQAQRRAVVEEIDTPRPHWIDGVPRCDEQCPNYDGKRCRLLGFRPNETCQPVAIEVSRIAEEALARAEQAERERDEARARIEKLEEGLDFACEAPVPGCDCPGCSLAREKFSNGDQS